MHIFSILARKNGRNTMFKKFILIIATLGLGLLMFACSSPKEKNTLTLGLQSGYPPYEYVDEQGHVVGFDVDIAQKIAAAMNKKLVIKEMGFDSLILALKNHKIDFIISGMSITESRLKEIDMVPYYGDEVTHLQLIFWNSTAKSMQDLEGKTIAVQSGTLQEEILLKYSKIEPKVLENIQELVMDIKYNKSIAALVEPLIGNVLKYKHPEIQSIEVPLLPEQMIFGNGIGISKENQDLKTSVEKVIKHLKESGEMEQLHKKWFERVPAK